MFLIPDFDRLMNMLQMSETEGNKQTFNMAAAERDQGGSCVSCV